MKNKLILIVGLTVLLISGCTQGTQPTETTALADVLDSPSQYANQTLLLEGKIEHKAIACTEMACFPGSNCTPGDEIPCNDCQGEAFLVDGDVDLPLRALDGGSKCFAQEIIVCEGETRYDFTNCPLEDGKNHTITAVLRRARDQHNGISIYPYFLEVQSAELKQ